MRKLYHVFLDWSEVWSLLIPLAILIFRKSQPAYLRPVKYYVYLALLINSCVILIWLRNRYQWNLSIDNNNFLYNCHSIVRLLLFSWFFISLKQHFMHRVKIILPIIFIVFIVINFSLYENYLGRSFSSRLLTVEAAILIFYCLQYFMYLLLEERHMPLKKQPGFWVAVGLGLYMAASFFIFLFYDYLVQQNRAFAISIWDVHNIAYIIFCICLARAFYER